jgi:hypothetical protein
MLVFEVVCLIVEFNLSSAIIFGSLAWFFQKALHLGLYRHVDITWHWTLVLAAAVTWISGYFSLNSKRNQYHRRLAEFNHEHTLGSMGVWQGVAMDSLKFHSGLPCHILVRPAGGPPLKRLFRVWAYRRVGGLRLSSSPLTTPRRTPMVGSLSCHCLNWNGDRRHTKIPYV